MTDKSSKRGQKTRPVDSKDEPTLEDNLPKGPPSSGSRSKGSSSEAPSSSDSPSEGFASEAPSSDDDQSKLSPPKTDARKTISSKASTLKTDAAKSDLPEDAPSKKRRRDEKLPKTRLVRELAMRLLFQHQAAGAARPDETLTLFERCFSPNNDPESSLDLSQEVFEPAWPKARKLFMGIVERLDELDDGIAGASANWAIDRMSPIDLALMRLALFEMRHGGVPPKVALNEAIEMARDFGNQDSAAFVNGILDKLLRREEKKTR